MLNNLWETLQGQQRPHQRRLSSAEDEAVRARGQAALAQMAEAVWRSRWSGEFASGWPCKRRKRGC